MREIGRIVELKVHKETPQGFYLITKDGEEILLPNKYVDAGLSLEDNLEVFIYKDSEDRPIATTLDPKIKLNEFAFLSAIDVNKYGAFFDWGLEKDLMVPYAEQRIPIIKGSVYLIYLYKDDRTDRLVGTTKFSKFLSVNRVRKKKGERVSILVNEEIDIGFKVIVDHRHEGMIYKNEIFRPVAIGDILDGYLQRIREDGKLDVTLNSARLSDVEQLANKIYERLLKEKGILYISDKTSPELIYREFQVSKKSFRRALGILYSDKKIRINPKCIELVKKNFD